MAIYGDGTVSKPPLRRADGASRRIRARAMVFMTIALGAGLSSAWMVTRYVARHSGSGTAVPMSKVVVAASDIPVAASLTPELLKVVDWPTSAQPQGSFERVDALMGRVAGSAVIAGEPVVEARLSPKGAGAGMASLIPANMRAMTVPVNEVIGVSGFIHPGDLVDVITTMQGPAVPGTNAGLPEQYRSKIVLQDIRVLAVGQQLSSDTNKPEAVPAVTLLVSPEESERLALASTQGKLQLTMRSQIDKEQLLTPGVSPPELLGLGRVTPPPAPPPAAPPPPPRMHPPPAAAAMAPKPAATTPVEVVEVFHGDRVEQRKLSAKGAPQ